MSTRTETVYDLFRNAAAKYRKPDALAAKIDGTWKPISHDELVERVRHLALGLHEMGVRRGDRVALLCESRPEWTIVDLATIGAGAALVPIYATLTGEQATYVLNDSGARVLVVSTEAQLAKMLPLLAEAPAVEHVVLIDPAKVSGETPVLTLADVEAKGKELDLSDPGLADKIANEITADDLITLIYTSGTTGRQKGVILTHDNIKANIRASFDECQMFSSDDVALSFLPQCHILERTAVYTFLQAGMSVYFAQSIDTVASDIREVRPTVMTSVPRLFEKMYAKIRETGAKATGVKSFIFKRAMKTGDAYARTTHKGESVSPLTRIEYDIADALVFKKWREALGGRVRCFISGGAPLAPDIAYAFLAAGIIIYEGYGLTETSPVIALNNPQGHKIGTVGKPLSNVDVRIAEDGEITVKGPSIMSGYYNLPEATAEAFTSDGYFKTGDIGEIDADGFLKITDRKKDLLKTSGGKYIAPQPIENAIKGSNLVSQVVVLGDRRKFCSALIVPNFPALEAECRARGIAVPAGDREALVTDPKVVKLYQETVDKLTPDLARYEQIKKVAILPRELSVEAGEMTPTLKVKRKVVEETFKDRIEALYDETGVGAHA